MPGEALGAGQRGMLALPAKVGPPGARHRSQDQLWDHRIMEAHNGLGWNGP